MGADAEPEGEVARRVGSVAAGRFRDVIVVQRTTGAVIGRQW